MVAVNQDKDLGVSIEFPSPQCRADYFPYGSASFKAIRIQKQYWKDNSRHIASIVETNYRHRIFLRPQRWGKSLFLDMVSWYLDIAALDRFEELFSGTDIASMDGKKEHRNQYHVIWFDLSIDVDCGDPQRIKVLLDEEIKRSVRFFSRKYGLNFDQSLSAFGALQDAVEQVENEKGGKVFILVDEYDRIANELIFENPNACKKIVAGNPGDALLSPVRAFFQNIKKMKDVRSFTVGLSPIALADVSGANFIDDISEVGFVGDLLGLTEEDIRNALTRIFGDGPAVGQLLHLVKRFYKGYHFRSSSGLTPPLYHTQLCLYFFRKLCRDSEFRRKAFAGTVTVTDMTDSNTHIGEHVINLLIRQKELAGILCQLKAGESVSAESISSFVLRDILEQSSRDFVVCFMRWHGLLTISRSGPGMFQIPNEVVGTAGGFFARVEEAMAQMQFDVRSVINEPSEDKVWDMNNLILSEMTTKFDNTISEAAIVGFVEARLRAQSKYEGFRVACEGSLTGWNRFDLLLIDKASKSLLLLEYKRLCPGTDDIEQDLCWDGKPAQLQEADSVTEANSQLLQFGIMPSKQKYHKKLTTVREMVNDALCQVSIHTHYTRLSESFLCLVVGPGLHLRSRDLGQAGTCELQVPERRGDSCNHKETNCRRRTLYKCRGCVAGTAE